MPGPFIHISSMKHVASALGNARRPYVPERSELGGINPGLDGRRRDRTGRVDAQIAPITPVWAPLARTCFSFCRIFATRMDFPRPAYSWRFSIHLSNSTPQSTPISASTNVTWVRSARTPARR